MSSQDIKAIIPGVTEDQAELGLRRAMEEAGYALIKESYGGPGEPISVDPGERLLRWWVRPTAMDAGSVLSLWEKINTDDPGWDLTWWRGVSGCLDRFLVGFEAWSQMSYRGSAAFVCGRTLEVNAFHAPHRPRVCFGATSDDIPTEWSVGEEFPQRYLHLCYGDERDLEPPPEMHTWTLRKTEKVSPTWSPAAEPRFTRILLADLAPERLTELLELAPWASWQNHQTSAHGIPCAVGYADSLESAQVQDLASRVKCAALGLQIDKGQQGFRWIHIDSQRQHKEGRGLGFQQLIDQLYTFALSMAEEPGMLPWGSSSGQGACFEGKG